MSDTPTGRALPHKPDWAHVFFSVLPSVEALRTKDPPKVAAALRAAAARVLCRQAAALRTAAVAEWEIRLRVRDGSGAWRVRATMPTGVQMKGFSIYNVYNMNAWICVVPCCFGFVCIFGILLVSKYNAR